MALSKTYRLPFEPGDVFAAWVSTDTIIAPATRLDIDPRVGGHYRLFIESDAFVARNEGVFLVVEPNHRLKYTWEWNKDGEVTEIEVSFDRRAEGTEIRLRHSGFQNDDSRTMHDSGWDSYIAGLIDHLKRR